MNSHHHLQAGAARSVALHHCRPTQLLLLLKAPHNQRSSLPRAHAFSGGEPHDAHDPSIIKTSTSNTPDGPAGKSGPGALPGAAATPLTHMQLLQQLFHSALATPPQLALPAPAGVSQMLTNYFHFIPSPNGAPDGNLLQPASKGSASTTQQQLASTPGSANNTGRSGSTRPARSALETIQEGTAAAAQSWTSLRLSVLMVWHRAHIASGPVTRELSNRLSASQSFAERVWLALVWQAGAAAIVMLAALNHGVHTLPPALLTSTLQAQYIARMAALVAQEAAAKSVVHATAATPLHFSVVENQKKRFIEAALPLQALLLVGVVLASGDVLCCSGWLPSALLCMCTQSVRKHAPTASLLCVYVCIVAGPGAALPYAHDAAIHAAPAAA